MKIDWTWKKFEDFSGAEMHEMLSVRENVFVVEQECAYLEADDLDKQSWHLIGRNPSGILIAYARITFPGSKYDEPTFGRVLTVQKSRGIGLGRKIIKECIKKSNSEYPGMSVRISAQTYLIKFYKDFGFKIVGQPYDDEGIEHIDMLLIQKSVKD